ncbi:MAG: choice-of-anchor D domain-containing protein [Actinomycetota bacterium]|nr:choice-of-anchor D domain-containing protein [Actinomycetota bacterium]
MLAGSRNRAGGLVLALALVAPVLAPSTLTAQTATGVTTRESLRSDPPAGQADAASFESSISADGRYVAFTSAARLAANDTNHVDDVYRRDRQTGTTVLVSVHAPCTDYEGEFCPSGDSGAPAISADGRHVAFESDAEDLALAPDTPPDTNAASSVFVREMVTGATTLVSRTSGGGQPARDGSFDPSISADGRYVAFRSNARLAPPPSVEINSLLVPSGVSSLVSAALRLGGALLQVARPSPVDDDSYTDYYRHDRTTGDTALLSPRTCAEDTCVTVADVDRPAISADGNLVAFSSMAPDREVVDPATGLPTTDTNGGAADIFLRDVLAATTTIVSLGDDGQQGDAGSFQPSISADGAQVAFSSQSRNFAFDPPAEPSTTQVYVRDRPAASLLRASQNDGGVAGNDDSHSPSLSPDGSHVSFASIATNLVPGDTNTVCTRSEEFPACSHDVFAHDLLARRTTRVSVNSAGKEANVGANSAAPSTADDVRVAFDSDATNLVADDTNDVRDVFVHEQECLPETATLINGDPASVEGAVRVTVDGLGAFGTAVPTTPLSAGAVFNPPDPPGQTIPAASTVFDTFTYLDAVDDFLVECAAADATKVSSTDTSLETTAVVGGYALRLSQQLSPVDAGGSTLVQTYELTILNETATPPTLVRYLDADLQFDDSIDDGGAAAQDGSLLYEFDSSDDPARPSTFVGISGQLDDDPVPERWTLQPYAGGFQKQTIRDNDGIPTAQNTVVFNDTDRDRVVDRAYDVTLNQQWDTSVPTGPTIRYTTVTRWGSAPPKPPAISVTPATFGTQRVGTTSAPQTVRVSNDGQRPATIASATVAGAHPDDFLLQAGDCSGTTLAPGASCPLTVRFRPTAEGDRAAQVVVTSDAPGSPHTASLTGVGVRPRLVLAPDPVDFAKQRVGTRSDARTATVTNVGSGPTEIVGVTPPADVSDFDLDKDGCTGLTLGPEDQCRLEFTFSPTRPGPRSGEYAVDDDTDAPPRVGGLVGVGVESRIVVEPDPVDFNGQRVDTVSDNRIVTVTNEGTAPTAGDGIRVTIDGAQAEEFHVNVDNCSGEALDPDESCTLEVAFAPQVRGPRRAQLVVSELVRAEANPVAAADLVGEGLEPEIVIRPDPVDFGEQAVGTTGPALTVTVTNVGTFGAFVGREMRGPHADEFAFVDEACSREVIEPGGECQLRLRFSPVALGRREARLVVFNHGANPRGNVDLAAAGLLGVGGPAEPAVAVDPNPIDFGPQVVGTVSDVRLATVTNVGDAPLSIDSVTLETPTPGEHVINAEGCSGAPLAPGESCIVAMRFTPAAGGIRGGALVLTDDAPDSPQRVLVVGLGLVPRLQVDPPLGRPGFVATVSGFDFPANTEVAVTWNPGLGGSRVVTGPDGTFRVPMLVFRRDVVGPRLVEARFGVPPGPAVTAEYLVVPGTYEPPGFVVRG